MLVVRTLLQERTSRYETQKSKPRGLSFASILFSTAQSNLRNFRGELSKNHPSETWKYVSGYRSLRAGKGYGLSPKSGWFWMIMFIFFVLALSPSGVPGEKRHRPATGGAPHCQPGTHCCCFSGRGWDVCIWKPMDVAREMIRKHIILLYIIIYSYIYSYYMYYYIIIYYIHYIYNIIYCI